MKVTKTKAAAYAAEGTDAHTLCEYKLKSALGIAVKDPTENLTYYNEEMEDCANSYAGYILELVEMSKQTCSDPMVLIEQRLDFSKYVPDGFGTGDCVIIADGTLHIVDYKHGQGVLVDAEDNPQMMLYGLGALEPFDGIYDIDTVSMTIFQPRRENVSTHAVSVESLYRWAEDVLKPTAVLAYEGGGEYVSGEHCRFCRAKAECRARAEEKLQLAAYEFALPPLLSDAEIAEILGKLNDLTNWANEIMAYATDTAVKHAKQWPGFKVVEGRSNRKYSDENAVAGVAIAAGYRDIYRQNLITITEMEKLLGKTKFNEVLGGLITKPPGKPTLVPLSDKRPTMNTSNAKNDFMEEL